MLLMLLVGVSVIHSGPWTRGNSDYYRRNNSPAKSESKEADTSEPLDETIKIDNVYTVALKNRSVITGNIIGTVSEPNIDIHARINEKFCVKI